MFNLDFRRENIGQTKSTTINYLKNLKMMFYNVLNIYVYEDQSFPKGLDSMPCVRKITKIKLLQNNLGLIYKKTCKQQPNELFTRKTKEADTIPEFSGVVKCLENMQSSITGYLYSLEEAFGNEGKFNVRSEKNSDPAMKHVCIFCALSSHQST